LCVLGTGLCPLLFARLGLAVVLAVSFVFGAIRIGSLFLIDPLAFELLLTLVMLVSLFEFLFVMGVSVLELLARKRSSAEPCDELLRVNCKA